MVWKERENQTIMGKKVIGKAPREERKDAALCERVIELEPRGSKRNTFRAKRAPAFHEDLCFGATIAAVSKPQILAVCFGSVSSVTTKD